MNAPVEVHLSAESVAEGSVELVADALFTAGASAVAEHLGPDGGVVLVADADPGRLDASGVLWQPHDPAMPVGADVPDVVRVAGRDLLIDSVDAFGHGAHPTTRGCLALLERVVVPCATVLDVGSGSGVLAVAAAALGAAEVLAIDNDPAAVAATQRTVEANALESVVRASDVPLGEVDGTFDVVVANLLIPIIEELGGDIAARVVPGGRAVISGVLGTQADRSVGALAPLEVHDVIDLSHPNRPTTADTADTENRWVAIELVRPLS